MKAFRGLNLAGFILGVIGAVVSIVSITFSTIAFLTNRK